MSSRARAAVPFGTLLAAAAGLLYLAYHFHESLIPFMLSFALAYLANPLINAFEARGLRREHIVILLYLVIATGVTIGANFLLPTIAKELAQLQSQAPAYLNRTREFLGQVHSDVVRRLPAGGTLAQHWSLQMYGPLVDQFERLPGYLLGLLPLLSLLFLVPFIAFYMLMDASRLMEKTIQLCPARYVEQTLHVVSEIDTSLGNYVRGMLLESAAITLAVFLGLLVLGVDYALGIATLTGVFNAIPYAGPLIGGAVAASVALFQFHSLQTVGLVLVVFGLIRLADDIILQPIISKHSVHLHPLAYLLALMLGGQAFGFVGLLFGVPVACIIKAFIAVAWDWYTTETGLWRPEPLRSVRIPYL